MMINKFSSLALSTFIIILIVALITYTLYTAIMSSAMSKRYQNSGMDTDMESGIKEHFKATSMQKYHERSGKTTTFYHLPYTYTYASNGGRPLDESFLAFMCLRFPERSMSNWTTEYNNPLQLVKDCIDDDNCVISDPDFTLQCKTSQIYQLNDVDPIKDSIEKIRKDIQQNMTAYSKDGIMAPVYMLVVQYPRKYDFDDYGNKGYRYSQFDIEDNGAKPCMTRNISKGTTEICNSVDTFMMLIYPMYSKETGKLYNYGVRDDTYNITPSNGNDGNSNEGNGSDGNEGNGNEKGSGNVKGIIDMVKFFGRYANKNQLCFIECQNNPSLFCGCATRREGADDPRKNPNDTYKSFCKLPYDDTDPDNTEDKFTHYAWMYRVNERSYSFKDIVADTNIDHDVERMINRYLQ